MTGNTHPPLIILLGATAVGKTGLAIQLANHFNGEIIGADSRQIYQYMDIGTAKPTPDQQAAAPHHLIDVVQPDQRLTLAGFQSLAYQHIDVLHQQGKLPLLVGGTGQYLTAVEEGWSIPEVEPNEELRQQLEAEAQAIGTTAFHQKLNTIDPEAAQKIHPNNTRRIVRALEVYYETGTPISILQRKTPPPYRILTIGLTLPREQLHQRADTRINQMMNEGFLQEVQALLDRNYSPRLSAMSALGYRELAAHLNGESTLEEAIEQIKIRTHQFIRQQEIWFRGHDNGILWHNMAQHQPIDIINTIHQWLNQTESGRMNNA